MLMAHHAGSLVALTRRYESTAYWRPLNEETGCSRDTPTACAVTQALRQVGLPVFRAGYSSLEPHAWLKPHFGMTNGQLKLHLGLIVPQTAEGEPCAWFRVSNVTNAWEQDQVLFFDDSFEHEVHNNCQDTRVGDCTVSHHVHYLNRCFRLFSRSSLPILTCLPTRQLLISSLNLKQA
jgi:hypothetical protein